MKRADFLYELRRGLEGMSRAEAADVLADYESHFEEGAADGRSEDEISAALGDPTRLARELRAEAGFRRWEMEGTPRSLAGAVLALLGLATFDLMFMFPLILGVAAMFLGLAVACLGVFCTGLACLFVPLFPGYAPGLAPMGMLGSYSGTVALALVGIGLVAGSVGFGALVWLALDFTARLLVRYARLHFQLINSVTSEGRA